MEPETYAVHNLPGRARFRIPTHRANRACFDEVARRLDRVASVDHVATNPMTGSVPLKHTGNIDHLIEAVLGADVR